MIHRDLRLENLLINKEMRVKISDFGASSFFRKDQIFSESCGTLPYMAPEMINGKYSGSKSDIWSLGVLLFVIICGHFPY